MSSTILQPKRLYDYTRYAAYIPAIGFCTVAIVGITGCLALALGVLWLCAQFCLLLIASLVESFSAVAALYCQSDPIVRFLILVALGFMIYRAGKYAVARK